MSYYCLTLDNPGMPLSIPFRNQVPNPGQTTSSTAAARNPEAFLGIGLLNFELILIGVSAAVSVLFWVFGSPPNVGPTLIFTLIVGNLSSLVIQRTIPFLITRDPRQAWAIYMTILIPTGAAASLIASLSLLAIYHYRVDRSAYIWTNLRFGTLISVLTGVSIYSVVATRMHWQERNRLLEQQVEVGAVRLSAQEADLKTAHEIQAHLLPRELPVIPGMEIACAWQPAQSVGGDYFDAFQLEGGETALCIADVSGKGISAALLMANLQAAFRAFAPQEHGPARLCARLNQTLCGTIAAAKFVTFFYAMVDPKSRQLRYENAGHGLPVLLREGATFPLEGGGTVLGLFPSAVYEDRTLQLRSGDCLLLMTDGVTEAARPDGEEFGEQRVVQAALRAQPEGVHAIRTRILEEVTAFCSGDFHDDASLMVLVVN